jgi:hypothetical protein
MFGENLLLNPSFEEVTSDGKPVGWTNGSLINTVIRKDIAHNGQQSFCFYNPTNNLSNIHAVKQDVYVDITTPTKILISGWAKKELYTSDIGASEEYKVDVSIYKHDGNIVQHVSTWARFQILPEWQYAYRVIEVKDVERIQFTVFFGWQKGGACFDELSLRVLSDCSTKCINGQCTYYVRRLVLKDIFRSVWKV